ncbi:MAG: hypothetical protein PHT44_03555 [Candidatus Portnoybacteria bacterium]|nr:hypothetical protein [Candidatus Portnoybacteria bacterium]MDD4983096.1 hypothetical protein [Candidatus Portnoybacteria bacterium]
MKIKKIAYLFASIVLGVLLGFLLRAAIEIAALYFFIDNFDWPTWLLISQILTAAFSILGVIFGYWIGKRWWQIVYVEKRYAKKWK